MTLGEQVADLQARIRAAQEQRMRAEMAAQAADAAAKGSRAELKELFGVTTTEDAQFMLEQLRVELDVTIAGLEKALNEVES